MGQAIVYCWNCQNKLVASDFDEARAFRAGGRTSCRDCVGNLVRLLSGRDREDLVSQVSRAAGNAPAPSASSSLKSTARLATVRDGGSMTPAAGTSAAKSVRSGPSPALWASAIAMGVVLVAVVWALRQGDSGSAARRGDAGRGPASEEAAARLKEAETLRETTAALAKRREARARDWSDIEREVAKFESAEDYGKATEFLRAARGRYPGEEWTQPVDRRLAELAGREKAAALARAKAGDLKRVPRSGLALWLRGDSGVVLEGSKVTRWLDQSDGHHDLRQDSTPRRPSFLPEGLNGKACLAFDGTSTSLHFDLTVNGLEGVTLCLVSACAAEKKGATGSDGSALYWDDVGKSGSKIYLCPFQTGVRFKFGTGQPMGDFSFQRPAPIGDRPTLTVIRKDGSTDELRTDGETVKRQGGTGPRIAACADRAALGIGKNDSHFSGRVAEVLVYGRAVPDSELGQIERYLSDKYGLEKK
jgi:hypothetical protein